MKVKSIDEAIEKACRDFGVSRDKLNIEILSDGSSGFLGLMGARKARIKAGLLSIDATLNMTPAPPQPETTEKMPEADITPAAFDPSARGRRRRARRAGQGCSGGHSGSYGHCRTGQR